MLLNDYSPRARPLFHFIHCCVIVGYLMQMFVSDNDDEDTGKGKHAMPTAAWVPLANATKKQIEEQPCGVCGNSTLHGHIANTGGMFGFHQLCPMLVP